MVLVCSGKRVLLDSGGLLSMNKLINFSLVLVALIIIIGIRIAFSRQQQMIYVDITSLPQKEFQAPYPPDMSLLDSIRVGDSSYNWIGQKSLEVADVQKTSWGGSSQTVIAVKVQALYDPRTRQYVYNNTPLVVGNNFFLNTNKTSFEGQIINVYSSMSQRYGGYTKKEADVTISWRKLEAWQADSLRGLPEVKSITVVPAAIDTTAAGGTVYSGYSTIYKDVSVVLRLRNIYCSRTACYFNGVIPIYVGSEFTVQSIDKYYDDATHKGFITNIAYTQ